MEIGYAEPVKEVEPTEAHQEKGLTIMIESGTCSIYHPHKGLILQTNMTSNRMFILSARIPEKKEVCFSTTTQDLPHLWHYRYAHLSHKGLQLLQTWNMVCGLPRLPSFTTLCIDCVKGKQHREPMSKKNQWRANQKLQLVHADICGPITPASNSQKRYILCFTDDYSRKAWIYFLLKKS